MSPGNPQLSQNIALQGAALQLSPLPHNIFLLAAASASRAWQLPHAAAFPLAPSSLGTRVRPTLSGL